MEGIQNNVTMFTANPDIPYALMRGEVKNYEGLCQEFVEINNYYNIFNNGTKFTPEGNNGDYISAQLNYKISANLIKKEARFLFASPPDIVVNINNGGEELTQAEKDSLSLMQSFINEVLEINNFNGKLLKAAKDCFIGKRVACLVNFNEEDGIMLTFHKATHFIYETSLFNADKLTKFVCFSETVQSDILKEKRIFKKKYKLKDNGVYLSEGIYDGLGNLIEEISDDVKILLTEIPAFIFINDGLTSDESGESEIRELADAEEWYSKLANADKDTERKSMNPTKYVVDMNSESTKGLSTAAGAFWDLASDSNMDNAKTNIGLLEPSMGYSEALKTTLNRIKTSAYETVDMPDVSLESMSGVITSGKALQAIYWGLDVRCMEKMIYWENQLVKVINTIITGAKLYPISYVNYKNKDIPDIEYNISITRNSPIPQDETEEKGTDLSEVESQVMSKKSYMKKWRRLTDNEATEELEQIALERQILEDASFELNTDSSNSSEEDEPVGDPEGDPEGDGEVTE